MSITKLIFGVMYVVLTFCLGSISYKMYIHKYALARIEVCEDDSSCEENVSTTLEQYSRPILKSEGKQMSGHDTRKKMEKIFWCKTRLLLIKTSRQSNFQQFNPYRFFLHHFNIKNIFCIVLCFERPKSSVS